jgi:hypothetical protein
MKALGYLLLIITALALLSATVNLGSDTSRWDCPGEPTPCNSAPWVPSHIPPHGVVLDGTLYCPENTEANAAMDGCVPLKGVRG